MKKFILIVSILFAITQATSQEKKNKNKNSTISVKGTCDMCKKRIEKAAYSVKGVKSAIWHINHQDLHLIYDENKCSEEQIIAAIAKTGHDTETVKATDEDYNNLHECCKFERN